MRRLTASLLLAAALVPVTTAHAQDPDTTPPTVKVIGETGTTSQLLVSGLSYSVETNEQISFTTRATMKYKGKTITVTKSLRSETHFGEVPLARYSLTSASSKTAINALRKAKKAVTVTITVTGKDVAGNPFTASTKVRFRKG